MSKSPFLKAVTEAFEDENDLIDFEKISQKYVINGQKIDHITKTLASLETVEIKSKPVNVSELMVDHQGNRFFNVFEFCF